MRNLYIFIVFAGLIFFSCTAEKKIIQDIDLNTVAELYHYYYVVEGETEQLVAETIKDENIKTLNDAIKIILEKLSEKYRVEFELENLTIIDSKNRDYKIALVNISDTANIMAGKYFQGSTGGMFTQSNILMTILQPQEKDFLNGCIIHLNGSPITEMDHVNFDGIMNPGTYEYKARQSVKK